MIIRKAEARDIDAIESIYNKILLKEEEGEVTTGLSLIHIYNK